MQSQRVHPLSDTGEEGRETRPDGMRHATERVRLSTGRTLCNTAARSMLQRPQQAETNADIPNYGTSGRADRHRHSTSPIRPFEPPHAGYDRP